MKESKVVAFAYQDHFGNIHKQPVKQIERAVALAPEYGVGTKSFRKIACIKQLRHDLKCGLLEAKVAVEWVQKLHESFQAGVFVAMVHGNE